MSDLNPSFYLSEIRESDSFLILGRDSLCQSTNLAYAGMTDIHQTNPAWTLAKAHAKPVKACLFTLRLKNVTSRNIERNLKGLLLLVGNARVELATSYETWPQTRRVGRYPNSRKRNLIQTSGVEQLRYVSLYFDKVLLFL